MWVALYAGLFPISILIMELGNGRSSLLPGETRFPNLLRGATAEEVDDAYRTIREATISLVDPLATEDYVVQSCPEASPPKWHLAHTTWFFETLVLERLLAGYEVIEPLYKMLFNSYYESVGPYFTRVNRGILSRPTVTEVMFYREQVDKRLLEWIGSIPQDGWDEVVYLIGWGLQHEQQHQELIMMDILANFAANPLNPSYCSSSAEDSRGRVADIEWLSIPEGVVEIGYDSDGTYFGDAGFTDGAGFSFAGAGFAYDNELPRHPEYLSPAGIAHRTVTNGEFLEFLDAGGYSNPLLWLSDGWRWVDEQNRRHPRYWRQINGDWFEFTLYGLVPLQIDIPVSHVSFYEADAYARWKGSRLPTEAEWEWSALNLPVTVGGLLEYGRDEGGSHQGSIYRAGQVTGPSGSLLHAVGDVWEWTRSPYLAYPGYLPPRGSLGEYNGKFMNGQYVLRGGCVATPASHIRPTYRNFFQPESTWAFSGIRLARDEL